MSDGIEPAAAAESPAETPAVTHAETQAKVNAAVCAKLEALPAPKIPRNVRSIYVQKFHLLDKMDARRLEIDKNKNHVSNLCSFCYKCYLTALRSEAVR